MHVLTFASKLSVLVLVAAACGPAPVDTTTAPAPAPAQTGSAGAEQGATTGDESGAEQGEGADVAAGEEPAAAEGDDSAAGSIGDAAGAAEAADAAPPTACTASGRATVRDVTVAVEGADPLHFASVTGVIRATVAERRAPTRLAVRDPLSFEGETRADVPYAIARPVDVANGAIHLAPATPITRVVPDGVDVRVDVDLADGVSVRGLPLGCAALALHATAPAAPPTAADEGLLSRGAILHLFAAPGAESEAVAVRLSHPTEVVLSETGRRDGWVRVWRSFDTGASLVGWVEESAIRPLTRPPRERNGEEHVTRERVQPPCEPRVAGFYLGPARVAAGTEVRTAAPDGPVWARTVKRDVVVRTLEDPAWVVLETIEGMEVGGRCSAHLTAAYVPRASITFPSDTRLPGAMPE